MPVGNSDRLAQPGEPPFSPSALLVIGIQFNPFAPMMWLGLLPAKHRANTDLYSRSTSRLAALLRSAAKRSSNPGTSYLAEQGHQRLAARCPQSWRRSPGGVGTLKAFQHHAELPKSIRVEFYRARRLTPTIVFQT
jgi:hypothetical protein